MRIKSFFRDDVHSSDTINFNCTYFDTFISLPVEYVLYYKCRSDMLNRLLKLNLKHSAFRPYIVFNEKRKLRLIDLNERSYLLKQLSVMITGFSGLYNYLYLDKQSAFFNKVHAHIDEKDVEDMMNDYLEV